MTWLDAISPWLLVAAVLLPLLVAHLLDRRADARKRARDASPETRRAHDALAGLRQRVIQLRDGAEYWRRQGQVETSAALEREATFVEKLVTDVSSPPNARPSRTRGARPPMRGWGTVVRRLPSSLARCRARRRQTP